MRDNPQTLLSIYNCETLVSRKGESKRKKKMGGKGKPETAGRTFGGKAWPFGIARMRGKGRGLKES